MQQISSGILSELVKYLDLTDVLALAISNSVFREKFLSKEFNNLFAERLLFPQGLQLNELLSYDRMSLNERIVASVKNNDVKLLEKFLSSGSRKYVMIMNTAAKIGNIAILKWMMSLTLEGRDSSFYQACKSAQVEIINFLYSPDISIDNGLRGAVKSRDVELVKQIIEGGARNFADCALEACESGNLEVVKLIFHPSVYFRNIMDDPVISHNLSISLYGAIESKNKEVIDYVLIEGAKVCSMAINKAIKLNDIGLLEYLLFKLEGEKNLLGLNTVRSAVISGNVEMVKFVLSKLDISKINNSPKLVKRIIRNALNVDELQIARMILDELNRISPDETESIRDELNKAIAEISRKGFSMKDLKRAVISKDIKFFNSIEDRMNKKDTNHTLELAAALGQLKLVQKFVDRYTGEIETLIEIAITHGHTDILLYLMSIRSVDLSQSLVDVREPHLDLFDLILSVMDRDQIDDDDEYIDSILIEAESLSEFDIIRKVDVLKQI